MNFTKIFKKIASTLILFLISSCFNKNIIFNDPGKDKIDKKIFNDPGKDKEVRDTIVSYRIYKDTLYAYKIYPNSDEKKSSIWEKEKRNISHHQMIFDHFAKIIPSKFREGITYFSIFYPENLQGKDIGTMGRKKEDLLDFFSLNLSFDAWKQKNEIPVYTQSSSSNTFGLDLVSYAFIHEFGHYLMGNKTQADLVLIEEERKFYHVKFKENSFFNQFLKFHQVFLSSNKEKMSIGYGLIEKINQKALKKEIEESQAVKEMKKIRKEYLSAPDDYYVSNYAKESPNEDAAETFTHFVLKKERPVGKTIAEQKILLFYKDSQMIEIRETIRKNLELLGFLN